MTPRVRMWPVAVVCLAFLIGCQENGSDPLRPDDQQPQLSHKPKHDPGGDGESETDRLPAQATFGDGPGDGVFSDGGGAYTDGVDKVNAHLRLDPRYDWVFRLFTADNLKGKEEPIRKLCFDFGQDVGIPSFPDGEGCVHTITSTGDPRDAAGTPVPDGLLGIGPGDQITMTSGTRFDLDGYRWALRFGIDCDGNNLGSGHPSRLTVTGGADDDGDGVSDAWTIEAIDVGTGSEAFLCKTPLKGKAVTTEVDRPVMPFLITVVRLA